MTLLNYTDPIPLPAPITSGSGIQSYTDPTGEVWVAKNGVNGGNWFRARDVLHASYHRSATFPTTGTAVTVAFDAVETDTYGLYGVPTASTFTCPLAGRWRIDAGVAITTTGTGQWIGVQIVPNTGTSRNTVAWAAGATWTGATTQLVKQLAVNDTVIVQANSSVALTSRAVENYLQIDYLGTG